jgi:hypothetical protein
MNQPIQSGDLCEVVGGMGRARSPNLGLTVTVVSTRGEHSRFGPVWRCEGKGVMQMTDSGAYIALGWADFPALWLRKLPPAGTPAEGRIAADAILFRVWPDGTALAAEEIAPAWMSDDYLYVFALGEAHAAQIGAA